jgi:hypothetical protein
VKELEDTFTPYARIGHVDEERLCDRLATRAFDALPGEVLPKRWVYGGMTEFLEQFGFEPQWSVTKNYHCYMAKGHHAFRVWTNTDAKHTWVDISVVYTTPLQNYGVDVYAIPDGSLKKCTPLIHRAKMTSEHDIDLVIAQTRAMYGLHQ